MQKTNRIDDQIGFLAWQIRPGKLEQAGLVEALKQIHKRMVAKLRRGGGSF